MARRLRRLGVLELVNIVLLPAVFFTLVDPTIGDVAAWIAVDAVLLVGAGYWLARAARAQHHLDQTPKLRAFAAARVALRVMLGLALAVVAVDIALNASAASWIAVAVWLFALAEYVNYFHVQLSYQSAADLRRLIHRRRPAPAHLGQELVSLRH